MGETTRRKLHYPEETDTPDVPRDIKKLAEELDLVATFKSGTIAERPAVGASKEGDIFWATDDLTYGAEGTPSIFRAGAWKRLPFVEVITGMIANLAVTAAKLAAESVEESKIKERSVTTKKIGKEAVTAENIIGSIKSGTAETPSLRRLGTGATEAAAGNDPRFTLPGTNAESIRPGQPKNTDWVVNNPVITNTGTGAFKFKAGGKAWLKDSGSSALVYTEVAEQEWNLVPPALPKAGFYLTFGIDLSSSMLEWGKAPVVSVSPASVEQSTEALAKKTPAGVAANHNRILDVIILNTAGVISYVIGIDRRISSNAVFAPGVILGSMIPGFAPWGFLFCNFEAVSRARYSELFAEIGTTAGPGDGSSTFNVPEGQNRFLLGSGLQTIGTTGGAENVTLTEAQMPSHKHKFEKEVISQPGLVAVEGGLGMIGGVALKETPSAGGGLSHTNMPPWFAGNWIIKT